MVELGTFGISAVGGGEGGMVCVLGVVGEEEVGDWGEAWCEDGGRES